LSENTGMDEKHPSDEQSTQQLCRLCGRRLATSREHLPPRTASNLGEVEINYIAGETSSGEAQVQIIHSSDGFWVPALCRKCNSKTGARYGSAYGDFVSQISNASGIEDTVGRVFVHLKGIYPLRILKQMFSMFLASLPYQPTPKWKYIQEFVLRRDTHLVSDAPFVYLYKNISRTGRIVPCCGVVEFSAHKTLIVSEVSWPPVGIIFSFQQDEQFAMMEDITSWGQYGFKGKIDTTIRLPKLRVSSHYPLGFGTPEEIEHEQVQRLLAYLFHIPDDSQSLTNICALWQRRA
jgi:hypothetical protein